jgi:hypothetical protein
MARIRTIKPDFFRHEGLQDLAAQHGAHVMLVFAGLWGHCDRFGRFECKPRHLKLDILPFLEFDMADTIRILEAAGFVQTYEVGSKRYGFIPSFAEHQRFGGKEASEPARYPEPPVKSEGSNGEAMGKQSPPLEWNKGMENGIGEEEGNREEPREKIFPPPKTRTTWPSEAVVPDGWITIAAQQRRLAGLPEIDLEVAARMFANHYAADTQNPRTMTEFQAKWNNWALKEKPANGSRTSQKSQLEQLADIVRSGQVVNG